MRHDLSVLLGTWGYWLFASLIWLWKQNTNWCCREGHQYLVEVVQSLVEVGMHSSRGFIRDFDGVLQDALRDDVALGGSCRLCTDEDAEFWVASFTVLFQLLFQGAQPLGHQVDVLTGEKVLAAGFYLSREEPPPTSFSFKGKHLA